MLEALEDKLRTASDEGTWQVYADALVAAGDPRGDVILLGERIAQLGKKARLKRHAPLLREYARTCRAARWPREGPWPEMHYRVRFEQMIKEISSQPNVTIEIARFKPPYKTANLKVWRKLAGASWPDG